LGRRQIRASQGSHGTQAKVGGKKVWAEKGRSRIKEFEVRPSGREWTSPTTFEEKSLRQAHELQPEIRGKGRKEKGYREDILGFHIDRSAGQIWKAKGDNPGTNESMEGNVGGEERGRRSAIEGTRRIRRH